MVKSFELKILLGTDRSSCFNNLTAKVVGEKLDRVLDKPNVQRSLI